MLKSLPSCPEKCQRGVKELPERRQRGVPPEKWTVVGQCHTRVWWPLRRRLRVPPVVQLRLQPRAPRRSPVNDTSAKARPPKRVRHRVREAPPLGESRASSRLISGNLASDRRLIGVAPWDPYPGWPPRERLLKVVGIAQERSGWRDSHSRCASSHSSSRAERCDAKLEGSPSQPRASPRAPHLLVGSLHSSDPSPCPSGWRQERRVGGLQSTHGDLGRRDLALTETAPLPRVPSGSVSCECLCVCVPLQRVPSFPVPRPPTHRACARREPDSSLHRGDIHTGGWGEHRPRRRGVRP